MSRGKGKRDKNRKDYMDEGNEFLVKKNSERGPKEMFNRKDLISNILGSTTMRPKFKTENQKKFYELIDEKEITFCAGAAGCGKTHIALAKSLALLNNPNNKFEKLVLVKPAIEAGENLGFLPGNLEEKLAPYLFPTYYVIGKIVGEDVKTRLIGDKVIEVLAIPYMRGLNIDNSIVVIDETQNLSSSQLKTLITRIGENSKFIFLGDVSQSDKFDKQEKTALYDAFNRYKDIDEIGKFKFTEEDIIRNPIIKKILKTYES